MNHLLRALVGLIIGAFCGAVVGAIILGLPLSSEDNCDALFGCLADWKLWVYIGSMCGGVAGGVIGLIVGIASSSRLKSMGIGALTALILAIEFFGVGGFIDEQVGPLPFSQFQAGPWLD
jgi:cytochrome bd-type quinol oxidase subunit 2